MYKLDLHVVYIILWFVTKGSQVGIFAWQNHNMKKIITVTTFLILSTTIFSQIPNGGFESWSNSSGYNVPNGWDNLNSMTSSMSVYTCLKGTPGSPGTAYLKLISKSVSGMGVMPGVATCGMFDMTNMSAPVPMSGFAFNLRPQSLDGKWQYMASGSDEGFIDVQLSYWDNQMQMRMPVATAHQTLSGMAMSWANFSIPLTYTSQQFPDSAIIVLSASGSTPVASSYLYVDTLHFNGSVAGTTGIDKIGSSNSFNLYPNPASNEVVVAINGATKGEARVQLTDVSGKTVLEEVPANTADGLGSVLNVSSLAKGMYFVVVKSGTDKQVKKLLVE